MASGVNLRNALLVGIDPGITTGIAILDAAGNILDVHSKRDITRAEIIRHILRFGKPIIVSSDVNIAPKTVEKIAVKLGCILYSPEISPSSNEKRELVREYYSLTKNDHELDALSAAIKAWKNHRVLFSKVDEVLNRFGKQDAFPDIILKIMKEESPNVEDAVREFIGKEKPLVPIEHSPRTQNNDIADKLKKKLSEKQEQIDSLQRQNILLSKALNDARKEISGLKELRHEIKVIENHKDLDSHNLIRKFRRIENKGYYPVVEIEKIDGDLLESIDDRMDLHDRVVLVGTNKNLNLLNSKEIKCLITFNEIESSYVEKLEFPVIKIDGDDVENFDDIKAIKIDYIEKRLAEAKKSGLIGWLKGYRKRKD